MFDFKKKIFQVKNNFLFIEHDLTNLIYESFSHYFVYNYKFKFIIYE